MNQDELDQALATWPGDQEDLKADFVALKDFAESLPQAEWEVVSRPQVSHSLRFSRPGDAKPVFLLLDAAYLDADTLMISACFYADGINDPDDLGDIIPEGLLGDDGYCFDMDEDDQDLVAYLKKRIAEAHMHAAAG